MSKDLVTVSPRTPTQETQEKYLIGDSNPQAETRDLKRREDEEEKNVGKDNTLCVLEGEDARSRKLEESFQVKNIKPAQPNLKVAMGVREERGEWGSSAGHQRVISLCEVPCLRGHTRT